jgi:ATP-dependent RNA helicase DDX24/MAK5
MDDCVLLATDIAARGLDIPAIDHVIHYQIPRSADVYVHRNGRTARAMRDGFSMMMCAPDERKAVRVLLGSLNRGDLGISRLFKIVADRRIIIPEEDDIPEMTVDLGMLDKLKARVQLARQIETSHHKVKKANHEKNWMKEAAKALEVELSDERSDLSRRDKNYWLIFSQ